MASIQVYSIQMWIEVETTRDADVVGNALAAALATFWPDFKSTVAAEAAADPETTILRWGISSNGLPNPDPE